MGGYAFDDGWEHSWPPNEVRTVVLVGKIGHGKSSTGNTIFGRRAFKSKASSAGVTCTSELQNTALEDGKILNVIDTPGLFDFVAEPEFVAKEIVKCIDKARDGIHALIVVLSVRSRFSREEEACIQSLIKIFGVKISDYMIVVFTGDDGLERDGETLEEYFGAECPESLKEFLKMCENRIVLFDNGTTDESKKSAQLTQLLFLVNVVVYKNGGKPFTNELFFQPKCGEMKFDEQTAEENSLVRYTKRDVSVSSNEEQQFKRLTELVEEKLKLATDEISRLREDLDKARAETENLRHKAERIHCAIIALWFIFFQYFIATNLY